MKNKYDVIVIGGGHNGLTAATLLAKSGSSVLVLEQRAAVGGLAASEEFAKGYRSSGILHDTSGVRRDVIKRLRLDRYGLELETKPPAVFAPEKKGRGILLHGDPHEAATEISRLSEKDAEAYIAFHEFIGRVRGFVNSLLEELPPDIGNVENIGMMEMLKRASAARKVGSSDLMELIRIGPMCVADWLDENFETDLLKAAMAGPAVYGTTMGPRSPGSAANLLIWECRKGPMVKGGPGALINSLEKAAVDAGVTIRTASAVGEIRVSGGRIEGVVVTGGEAIDAPVVAASCDPKRTFLELVAGRHISEKLDDRIRHFRAKGTTAKVNIALNARLEMAGRAGAHVDVVRIGERLDDLEKAHDAIKYGEYAENLVLDVYLPTASLPTRAPEGHSVLSILAHFVPYDLKRGWDFKERENVGARVIEALSQYSPALKSSMVSHTVLIPPDLEVGYGITGGHVHHGEHALDQLVVRPTPECGRYATPIRGLFLCGSGSHPGGGITCAPGAMAANVIAGRTYS